MSAPQRDVAIITSMLNCIESPELKARIEAALKHEEVERSRVLTADEVGRILNKSARTVHTLANQGLLRRVKFPGRQIGGGFLESDVRALLARSVEWVAP